VPLETLRHEPDAEQRHALWLRGEEARKAASAIDFDPDGGDQPVTPADAGSVVSVTKDDLAALTEAWSQDEDDGA
jgi:hypothetical protein